MGWEDGLLTTQDQQEALSRAYTRAIAAGAGYTTGDHDFDREGIDLTICAGGHRRPRLDVQLKATINFNVVGAIGKFECPVKNYNLLRQETMVPRVLVVLAMPGKSSDWLKVTASELIMKKCAYWVSLLNAPSTSNLSTITIDILVSQTLTVDSLKHLMEKARSGTVQ